VARAERRPLPHAARLCAALALAALAGCSTDLTSYSTIVTQDKYDFLTCAQIIGNRAGLMAREKELSDLVAKAESSPGGVIASFAAYRSDLAVTRANIVAVNRAAQKNGCDAPKKP
jgi:hypothetical protein